ncbi:MAG TPA: TonB family protein [Pyrinomonadaceae bacterium]|jgi:TonB family protein
MLVYGLRLLVALITFGVGVTASSLLGLKGKAGCGKHAASRAAVLVAAPAMDAPPPPAPRNSCYFKKRAAAVVHGGVLDGKAVSKPAPLYPAEAMSTGVRGAVAVRVLVGEGGLVETAEAESGPFMLREAAEEAARLARFSPTLLSGEPVKVSGYVTYNFGLR